MRWKPIEISTDYLVIGLSTAMYSGIHLCTQVGVIVTRMPLYSATVILSVQFSERINSV